MLGSRKDHMAGVNVWTQGKGGFQIDMSYVAEESVQVSLIAAPDCATFAAPMLVQHFGLTLRRAEQLLMQGRGEIAASVAGSAARAALPIMAALGLQVVIGPIGAEPETERFDLSVRLVDRAQSAHLIETLQRLTGAEGLTEKQLAGPSGYVVEDLTESGLYWLSRALDTLPGKVMASGSRAKERFDLFGPVQEQPPTSLRTHIRALGQLQSGPGDALATGLDRQLTRHFLAKFPDFGLFAVRQEFQRFDLFISGKGNLSTREFDDFLATRTGEKPRPTARPTKAQPLRIETWLTWAAAGQFLRDYAEIGIPAHATLIRD